MRRVLFGLFLLCSIVCVFSAKSYATINPQIAFQGKLANPDGTNVADGSYSIVFSLYTAGSGGSSIWSETKSITLSDGLFQTNLGDTTALPGSVSFNVSSLYLGIKVGTDAEMTPRVSLTASPFAFNSENVGGLSKDNLLQLAQGVQTDSSTANASLFVNKTGGTANILQLQRNGANVLTINNNGDALFKNQSDSTTAFAVQKAGSTVELFSADAQNDRIYVGDATPDGVGALLVLDAKNTTGDPAGIDGGSYYNSDDRRSRCYENGQWQDCLGAPRPNVRRPTMISYPGSGTAYQVSGDVATISATTNTAVAATTAEPAMLDHATSTTSATVASVSGNANYLLGGRNVLYQSYVSVPTLTTVRVWAGMTNQTAATMAASANPAGRYAAFRFDTSASDTTWKCITKDNTTQNVLNSGVTVTANGFKLEIQETGTTDIIFRINGARVCTSSVNLPGAGTLARYVNSATTLTTAARSIRTGWIYIESDK